MTTRTDVVIIGGGIAGLTVALNVADRGFAVTVIDLPSSGAASRAAAGMLAPSLEGMPPHVLSHALQARDFYVEFLAALRERTGIDVELNRLGILELADREEVLSALRDRAGTQATVITSTQLAELEPALAPHAGAMLHPCDGAVDNVQLMQALVRAVSSHPRIELLPDRVIEVQLTPDVRARTSTGSTVAADWLVVAAGAWINELAGLPRTIPVHPVRGQLLSIDACPLRHVMYAPRTGYLVPRSSTLVVGATIEQTGFVNEITKWGRQELLAVVARTLPSLVLPRVLDHWSGLRPMTPDTLPVLGSDPTSLRLVYAGGFSRNGILLAPWAASLLGDLLATERQPAPLDSFSIARFSAD